VKDNGDIRMPQVDARDVVAIGISKDGTMEDVIYMDRTGAAACCILARDTCFLLALGPVRAVVYHDTAFILGAHDHVVARMADAIVASINSDLEDNIAFELEFLEAALDVVTERINSHVGLLSKISEAFLNRVQLATPQSVMDELVHSQPLLDELSHMEVRIKNLNSCISEVLASDQDMTAMLLTARAIGRAVDPDSEDHDEVELVLEASNRKLRQSLEQVDRMTKRVRFGWALSDVKLGAFRARMDLVNVQLGVGALALGVSAAIAGFFGMNVPVPMAETSGAFSMIIASCAGIAGLIIARFWSAITTRTNAHEQRRMEAGVASKNLLANIVAVRGALKASGLKFDSADVSSLELRHCLHLALKQPITEADEKRVRELLPLLLSVEEVAPR